MTLKDHLPKRAAGLSSAYGPMRGLGIIIFAAILAACTRTQALSPVPSKWQDSKLVVNTFELRANGKEIGGGGCNLPARELKPGKDLGGAAFGQTYPSDPERHLALVQERVVGITSQEVSVEVRIETRPDFSSAHPEKEVLIQRIVVPYDEPVRIHPLPTIYIEARFDSAPAARSAHHGDRPLQLPLPLRGAVGH